MRFRIEREVGQLNFQDFISNVNLDTNVLSAGNAELRPDKTWAYEVAYEKRFWGNGAAVLTLRHEEITDVVDGFPFLVFVDANGDGIPDDANNDGQPDTQLVSGPGNIGDGKNDVLDFNLTLPMEKLGIKGGELKVQSMFQNSEVRDPLTGEMRRIAGQRPNKNQISYRQDLPAKHLTIGLVWFAGWSERYYNLEDVQSLDLRNFWATYLEYKPTSHFTLRADIKNFNPYSFAIRREVFDGPRNTGSLETVQTRAPQLAGDRNGHGALDDRLTSAAGVPQGVNQIGEVQARSWIVAATRSGTGRWFFNASRVDHRGVGISRTRA